MSGLAVVTGGAGALGTAIARKLAAAGNELLLVDLALAVEETAATLAGEGAEVGTVLADLTTDAGAGRVFAAVGERGGEVAVLVNSAGITRDARVAKMEESDFAAVIAINLVAAMRLSLALEPLYVEGAAVVNMSSRAGLGNFGQANYVTSKSGLVGATRALALRWAPKVRVNAVAPSLIASPMTAAMPTEVLEKLVAKIPAGRVGSPEEVADLVSFLLAPESSYVTGQVIVACGGRSIAPS